MKFTLVTKWFSLIGRSLTVVLGMLTLVATIAWLSGMFESKIEPGWTDSGGNRLTNQLTDEVHEVTKMVIEEAIGTLRASSRTELSAKVMATIESMNVTAGDEVQQDQLLVQLDSREFRSRLDQARQALDSAVASSQLAESSYKRAKSLAN